MASEFSREFFSANRIVKADLHCARQPREQDLDKIKAELKSHRGAAKRFSFTKNGKVTHKQMNANHQVHLKTTKRTRHLRADGVVDNAAEARTIRKLLPYK